MTLNALRKKRSKSHVSRHLGCPFLPVHTLRSIAMEEFVIRDRDIFLKLWIVSLDLVEGPTAVLRKKYIKNCPSRSLGWVSGFPSVNALMH